MKIAFLFSGQLRALSKDLFRLSIRNLTEGLDYEIYVYLWDELGKSMNHAEELPRVSKIKNGSHLIKEYFEGFNVKEIQSESFFKFQKSLTHEYKNIISDNRFHKGTVNSIYQVYCLSKCFDLVKNINDFDLIFKCRFDSLYVHPLDLYNLKKIKEKNKVFSINFGRAFYPYRIYDIFFGGSLKSMSFLNGIWEQLPSLISDDFNNNLDKRDACRIFYLAAKKNNIRVDSFDTRICDVFRPVEKYNYEKYLISMHLVSLKKFMANIKFFIHFIKWIKLRKISISKVFLNLLKSIILMPISFLKRIKYYLVIF